MMSIKILCMQILNLRTFHKDDIYLILGEDYFPGPITECFNYLKLNNYILLQDDGHYVSNIEPDLVHDREPWLISNLPAYEWQNKKEYELAKKNIIDFLEENSISINDEKDVIEVLNNQFPSDKYRMAIIKIKTITS